MKKLFLLSVFSLSLVASEISLSLKLLEGDDAYVVRQNNLKAELIFPYHLYLADLAFTTRKKAFYLKGSLSLPIAQENIKGEDFDWDNGVPTFYSNSDDEVTKYLDLYGELGHKLTKHFSYALFLQLQKSTHTWRNLEQIDYSDNSLIQVTGTVLSYEQNRYDVGIKSDFSYVHKKYALTLSPAISYVNHEARDNHLLRNFYTLQANHGLAMKLTSSLSYHHTKKTKITLAYAIDSFKDNNSNMEYFFNGTTTPYKVLPSSYESLHRYLSLTLGYKF